MQPKDMAKKKFKLIPGADYGIGPIRPGTTFEGLMKLKNSAVQGPKRNPYKLESGAINPTFFEFDAITAPIGAAAGMLFHGTNKVFQNIKAKPSMGFFGKGLYTKPDKAKIEKMSKDPLYSKKYTSIKEFDDDGLKAYDVGNETEYLKLVSNYKTKDNTLEEAKELLRQDLLQHGYTGLKGSTVGHGDMTVLIDENYIKAENPMFDRTRQFQEVADDPVYFYNKKDGLKAKQVMMKPQDYIDEVNGKQPDHKAFGAQENQLKDLEDKFDAGVKVDSPWLIYGERDMRGSERFGQEGYHRATTALNKGLETMPVDIRYRDSDTHISPKIREYLEN